MKQNLRIKLISTLSLVILVLLTLILIKAFSNRVEIGIKGDSSWEIFERNNISFKYPKEYEVLETGEHLFIYDKENENGSTLSMLIGFAISTDLEESVLSKDCEKVSKKLISEILDPQVIDKVSTKSYKFITIHEKETCEIVYVQDDNELYVYLNYHNKSPYIFMLDQVTSLESKTFPTLRDILRTLTFKESENTDMSTENKNNKYSSQPEILDESLRTGKIAIISTSKGDIKVELNGEKAPLTTSNFIFLSNEKFYDDLTFHRVVDGFVVQGGDPLGLGNGGPGYQLDAEHDNGLSHEVGAIAMARLSDEVNPERKSSGSQFYIVTGEASFLDGDYTVFGKVIDGMDIVLSITQGDKINSISIQ